MRSWSQLKHSPAFPVLLAPAAALVTTSTIAKELSARLPIGCHHWPSRWDASQSCWGGGCSRQGWAQAHARQPTGQKPGDHKCTMLGPQPRPTGFQTQSSAPVPRQGPWRVAHPELPALHLHVALLDNVVEIGRHGFPTLSWAQGLAEARGGTPRWPQFPAPPDHLFETLLGASAQRQSQSRAAPHLARLSIVLAAPSPGAC